MKKLILVAALLAVGWHFYGKYRATPVVGDVASPRNMNTKSGSPQLFSCDGRTYCSQMTSCEEATFFLRNCPGVKMDGNHDGIPCEKQWCKWRGNVR
jgi:hypothetical protein